MVSSKAVHDILSQLRKAYEIINRPSRVTRKHVANSIVATALSDGQRPLEDIRPQLRILESMPSPVSKADVSASMGLQRAPRKDASEAIALLPQIVWSGMLREKLGFSVADSYKIAYRALVERAGRKWPHNDIANASKVIDYMQNELRTKPKNLKVLLTRTPKVLRQDIEHSMGPILEVLRFLGLDTPQISQCIQLSPNLLTIPVSETDLGTILLENLDYFGRLNIDQSDFTTMIIRFPRLLGLSLEEHIKPVIRFLVGSGIQGDNLRNALIDFPSLLGVDLLMLQAKYRFMVEHMGGSGQDIALCPRFMTRCLESTIGPRLSLVHKAGMDVALPSKKFQRVKPKTFQHRLPLSYVLRVSTAVFCKKVRIPQADYYKEVARWAAEEKHKWIIDEK